MTYEEFCGCATEPNALTPPLRALWCDVREDWDRSHRLVQDDPSAEAAWVHAYLHRKEGDIGNARYWYARAGRTEFRGTLEAEREEIARELLSR